MIIILLSVLYISCLEEIREKGEMYYGHSIHLLKIELAILSAKLSSSVLSSCGILEITSAQFLFNILPIWWSRKR